MDKFTNQLQRLFFLPGHHAIDLGAPRQRCLLIDFSRSADWPALAELYEAVQRDLDLPAPAVSVSASHGFRLWFSLADGIPVEQGERFLLALYRRYLSAVPEKHVSLYPGLATALVEHIDIPPYHDAGADKWSAFIDPSLGSMFADEAGLDMAPGMDKQAALLAACASMPNDAFELALVHLLAGSEFGSASQANHADTPSAPQTLSLGGDFADPYSFLLAVMNDRSAAVEHRLEAAKALLPYSRQCVKPQ